MDMLQVLKKDHQFTATLFNGKLVVNKPVVGGYTKAVAPYSNLFYWSHARAREACEFGLHPHKGFEIMTFVLEGSIAHFDTASNVWTSLYAGDFQIIQSNRGIQHQERIASGTRSFQIWFTPDFGEALQHNPAYLECRQADVSRQEEPQFTTLTYVGLPGTPLPLTPGLTIKKLVFAEEKSISLPLDDQSMYTFYVVSGTGTVNAQCIEPDDAIRLTDINRLDLTFAGELFYIQTPAHLPYKAAWTA